MSEAFDTLVAAEEDREPRAIKRAPAKNEQMGRPREGGRQGTAGAID